MNKKKQVGNIKSKYTIRADGRIMHRKKIGGIQRTVYGKTDKEIDEKIRAYEMQALLGKLDDNTMLDFWATKWFQTSKEGKVAHATEQSYRNALNVHILPYFHNKKISDIKPIHIQEFINTKADKSNSLQHDILITLNQIFNSAVQNGMIVKSPMVDIKKCGVETKEREALTRVSQNQLIESVKGTRAELFINIALYTGLRRGEILALTWEDIDFKDRILNVNKAAYFEINKAIIKETKTKAGNRQIPIPYQLLELLKMESKENEYIVSDVKGRLMSKIALKRMFEVSKVSINPHKLRHTYCTNLYTAGIDLKTAQYLMGHSSIAVTAKIYTHLDKSHVKSAQEKLDEYYKSVSKVCQNPQNTDKKAL